MLRRFKFVGSFLVLATLVCAAQSPRINQVSPTSTEPKLPVINTNGFTYGNLNPDNGRIVTLLHDQKLYASWDDQSSVIGTLKVGQTVSAFAGVEIILKPDQALLTQTGAEELTKEVATKGIRFERGDVILRYGFACDGDWDFWAKGVRFKFDCEHEQDMEGNCGFGDNSCEFFTPKPGIREWWIKVKTRKNLLGGSRDRMMTFVDVTKGTIDFAGTN